MKRGDISKALRRVGIPQVGLYASLPTMNGWVWVGQDENEVVVILEPTGNGWSVGYDDSSIVGKVTTFESARAALDLLDSGCSIDELNTMLQNLGVLIEGFEDVRDSERI